MSLPKFTDAGTFPSLFYETTISLTLEPKKPKNKRKLQANIFDEYVGKNPQQNTSTPSPTVH